MTTNQQPPASKQPVKDVDPRQSTILGFGFALDLGYTIAIPAVFLGFGGGYLDKMMNSSPLYLLLGLLLAFVISFTIVWRKVKLIMARMPKVLPKRNPEIDVKTATEQEALHDLFRPPTE
jgi:F0F1-type ATP synthase assembly protein I